MPVVSPATFNRLLGTLDQAALVAFVADLWAARGWETAVADGVVTARGGPASERRRIVPVAGRSWGRGDPLPADLDPDVVVATRDSGRLDRAARDRAARFVGPAELRAMVLYGLDRTAADRLFRDHFGRPLAAEPSAGARLAAWVRPRPVLLGLALVVLGTFALAAGLQWGPGAADAGLTPTPAPVVGTAPPDSPASTPMPYPPGLTAAGVDDPDELSSAHRRAVANRTYDLLLIHRGSADLLNPGRVWSISRQTVERQAPDRFHYRVTGQDVTASGDPALVVFDEYADGAYAYRRVASSTAPTYQRGPLPGPDVGAFTVLGEAYVGRYLATTTSRVEVRNGTAGPRYRVTATGSPLRIGWPVENYTAVALVTRTGFVQRLTVEYTRRELPPTAGPTPTEFRARYSRLDEEVRFELAYRDVNETRVQVPPWYDEARLTTDETVLLRPRESLWWTQPIGVDYDGP